MTLQSAKDIAIWLCVWGPALTLAIGGFRWKKRNRHNGLPPPWRNDPRAKQAEFEAWQRRMQQG